MTDAVELDPPLGIAICHGCGCWFAPDLPDDVAQHETYHELVLRGEIPRTDPGKGPLRMLSDEIRKAHARRRAQGRRRA